MISYPIITVKSIRIRASSAGTIGADADSWYSAVLVLALILIASIKEIYVAHHHDDVVEHSTVRGSHLLKYRSNCDEIYMVEEGETLHTISDKCGDPFIVERNPHIHDPDDVFPGLLIKIIPNISSN